MDRPHVRLSLRTICSGLRPFVAAAILSSLPVHNLLSTIESQPIRMPMSRYLTLLFSGVVLLVASCGGSAPAPSSASHNAAESPNNSSEVTTSAAPSKPTHGILVATEDAGIVEIGMINPDDGAYAVENSFETGDFAKGPNEPDVTSAIGFSMVVAPDRTKIMAQRAINGDYHTGWINADGTFVDVTAATLGQRNDFSGPISSFGVGFNRQGNFHYGVTKDGQTEIWSLPPGQTTGQKLLDTVDLLTVYRFDADGVLQFALQDTCDDFRASSWMGDWYLYSSGTQIFRAPRVPQAGPCHVEGQPLLPDTNTASVSDPVASPDLRHVAFVYENSDSTRSIYIVSADGSSQPRKIDHVQWPSNSTHLVGWV
jgi:hypothetical protein